MTSPQANGGAPALFTGIRKIGEHRNFRATGILFVSAALSTTRTAVGLVDRVREGLAGEHLYPRIGLSLSFVF